MVDPTPTTNCYFAVFVVQGVNDLPIKKRAEAKRNLSKMLERRFLDAKPFHLDTEQEATLVIRHMAMQKQKHLTFRERRSYLLAQHVAFEPNEESGLVGTLKVSGYVRGQNLDVNKLVHIVGHGDFQMSQVDGPPDPMPMNPKVTKKTPGAEVRVSCRICEARGEGWGDIQPMEQVLALQKSPLISATSCMFTLSAPCLVLFQNLWNLQEMYS